MIPDSAVFTATIAPDRDTVTLELANHGPEPVTVERFAFSSVCPVAVPPPGRPGPSLTDRVSTHHEVTLPAPVVVPPGGTATWGPFGLGFRPAHANDGPLAAYLVLADGSTRTVATAPPRLAGPGDASTGDGPGDTGGPADGPTGGEGAAVVTAPVAPPTLDCPDTWRPRLATLARLIGELPATAPRVGDVRSLRIGHAGERAPGTAAVTAEDGAVTISAADIDGAAAGLRSALDAAAAGAGPAPVTSWEIAPRDAWRGLHLDLARQWFPAPVVERVIDTAARFGCSHLHLHLTDDEAWRLPVPSLPELTTIGARRGHGLPLPPLLASGPAPSGGAYTPDEIRAWVARADRLGVTLVPEIDLPGHCYAALQALPRLRDPDHRPTVASIQWFVGNVLYPGLATTMPVIEAALGAAADLFPGPVLHLGGDEVPARCWDGAPSVAAYAASRGLGTDAEIQRSFLAEVADVVRSLGREVAVWQEGADSLAPGQGLVMAWKSHDDVARLLDAGHRVVACPASHWYLDLAADERWETRGASWAGHLTGSVAAVAAAGPGDGDPRRTDVVGTQACLWTEHVPTLAAIESQLHPRLGLLAATQWSVTPHLS